MKEFSYILEYIKSYDIVTEDGNHAYVQRAEEVILSYSSLQDPNQLLAIGRTVIANFGKETPYCIINMQCPTFSYQPICYVEEDSDELHFYPLEYELEWLDNEGFLVKQSAIGDYVWNKDGTEKLRGLFAKRKEISKDKIRSIKIPVATNEFIDVLSMGE